MFRAWRHRDFRLYATGQGVSLVGTWMQTLAMSWLVYQLTKSTFLMGAAAFCTQFPTLPLGPLAGLIADRYSRRRIIILMNALMMGQAILMAVLTYTGSITVTQIMLLALLLGTFTAFETPARQSIYVLMVGREDLASAIALNSTLFSAARVVGPSIGGFMVAAVGEGTCFSINAVSYLAVLTSFAVMRTPEHERENHPSPFHHFREGLGYAWKSPPLRSLLTLSAITNFATAPVTVLAPVFADAIFRKGAQGYGFLSAAFGVGAIFGTLTVAFHGGGRGAPKLVWLSAAGVGVSLFVYAGAPVYSVCLAASLLAGFSIMRQLPGTNTLVQSLVTETYRGRVMSYYTMSVIGVAPLGNLASGALAEMVGARWTMFAGGVLCLVGAIEFGRTRGTIEQALVD